MNYLNFEPIKLEGEGVEDGRKILYVDVLPEKSCTYNCPICFRKKAYMGPFHDFGNVEDSLATLSERIEADQPDLVYLFGQGDPITNDKIDRMIDEVHKHGLPVRIIVNGPMLDKKYHMREANMCDEVVGCLAFIKEEDFQKMHRPIPEVSAAQKIQSLITFSHQYSGKFILRIVIFKGFYDTDEQLAELKAIVDQIRYDELSVGTRPTGRLGDKYAVSNERLAEIKAYLES
ncbi:MAG: radical SAM protein [Clostridiales bacterium]|nr:radical SAM protein [Clostridiales bacterium]